MTVALYAVDPQYVDGTDLSLVPPQNSQPSTTTSTVIWRLIAIADDITPKGLYLPIDKSLVVDALSTLFPQLSSSCTSGPDLQRVETCLANSNTFTLFIATETIEKIFYRPLTATTTTTAVDTIITEPTDLQGPPRFSFKISKIVGCLTLITLNLLMNTRAHIEDLVVSNHCRGQGVGRGLMKRALFDAVHIRNCSMVDLTSKPDRVQARALYESLGFQIRDTGAYRYYAPSI